MVVVTGLKLNRPGSAVLVCFLFAVSLWQHPQHLKNDLHIDTERATGLHSSSSSSSVFVPGGYHSINLCRFGTHSVLYTYHLHSERISLYKSMLVWHSLCSRVHYTYHLHSEWISLYKFMLVWH